MKYGKLILIATLLAVAFVAPALAQGPGGELADKVKQLSLDLDTVWVLIAGFLVFWMQAGFGAVECGFTRAKNAVNIMAKNLMDFAMGSVVYWAVGFAIMFGAGNVFFGHSGWFLHETSPDTFASLSWSQVPIEAKFFFQLMFAAAAATIVAGAMAERTKFSAYIIYSIAISAFIYPVVGHWVWGGGWLQKLGMWDFAGSTVVHSTGGWLALMGAIFLGPRLGRFRSDGSSRAIPGHNIPLATLGVFILWLGWFGFNPGSTMAADAKAIAHIALTTNAAAAAGTICALALAWAVYGAADLALALNGALAGLVAITASCAFVSAGSAVVIGAIGAALMIAAVAALEKLRVDDPVGAFPVHGVNGVWGTLAVGLFAQDKFSPGTTGNGLLFGGGSALLTHQLVGIGAVALWCIATGAIVFGLLRATVGLRVSAEEELQGLDLGEHGAPAYAPELAPSLEVALAGEASALVAFASESAGQGAQ